MCAETNLPTKIGRFEIEDELGRGGMATVFRANDPHFKRDVAIKVLPAVFTHDPTFRARFEREAQLLAALEYPGIVPVYDYGEENDQPYLVMRYMPGGSLSQRLKDGPLTLIETSRIFTRLGTALDYIHDKGIVHRDMKPANILFDGYGNAYLSDFGIARITQSNIGLTGDGLIGTPAYMSPEQARGDVEIDGRSDIYALGAILFETLTGRQPYEATTPMGVVMKHITDPIPHLIDLNREIPADCQELIDKAMAKDREQRFQTAASMAIAVAVLAGKTRKQPSPPGSERTERVNYAPKPLNPAHVPGQHPVAGQPASFIPPSPPSEMPPSPSLASANGQSPPTPSLSPAAQSPQVGQIRHPPAPLQKSKPALPAWIILGVGLILLVLFCLVIIAIIWLISSGALSALNGNQLNQVSKLTYLLDFLNL
jgi:serine/threonine protein kinase